MIHNPLENGEECDSKETRVKKVVEMERDTDEKKIGRQRERIGRVVYITTFELGSTSVLLGISDCVKILRQVHIDRVRQRVFLILCLKISV